MISKEYFETKLDSLAQEYQAAMLEEIDDGEVSKTTTEKIKLKRDMLLAMIDFEETK